MLEGGNKYRETRGPENVLAPEEEEEEEEEEEQQSGKSSDWEDN